MKNKTLILLTLPILLLQCNNKEEKVLIPVQENNFVNIYQPAGDYFFGPDTDYLTEGTWYDEWVPNDHCFVKGKDNKWHVFGITHPLVKSDPLNKGIHDGEYASFHAISETGEFQKTFEEGHYKDLPKVLPPKERPGEVLANHAPYIIEKDGEYLMFYGHSPIRLAASTDLNTWETKGELFIDEDGARDPNVLLHEGTYYVTYCSDKSVRMRKSEDLIHWSDIEVILKTEDFDPESLTLLKHNNTFYLFVCSWDGVWDMKDIQGAYQQKTYVYQSDSLHNFGTGNEKEICTLNAHAPEIFEGEDGQWYISSVEWPKRGVSVDRLSWKMRK